MIPIIESIFALLLGIALTIFGLIHSISRYPGPAAFEQLANCTPALGAVLLFALGVVGTLSGVTVLLFSLRRLRFRWRHLHRLIDHRTYGDPRDGELAGGYR